MEYKVIDDIDKKAVSDTLKYYGLVIIDIEHITQEDLKLVKKSYFYLTRIIVLRMNEVGRLLAEQFNEVCHYAATNFDKFVQILKGKGGEEK